MGNVENGAAKPKAGPPIKLAVDVDTCLEWKGATIPLGSNACVCVKPETPEGTAAAAEAGPRENPGTFELWRVGEVE